MKLDNYKSLILLCIIIAFAIWIYTWRQKDNDIRLHGFLVLGKIYYTHQSSKGGIDADYYYYANGIKYKGGYRNTSIRGLHVDKFIDKPALVIYSKINPQHSYLLLLPNDYKEFNISMPDSLKWVYKYMD